MIRRLLSVIVLVVLFGSASVAATYYVATTGSDANPGTLTAPFGTLAHAQSVMNSSSTKTLTIRGGTYTLSADLSFFGSSSGQTWIPYQNETPIIDGASLYDLKGSGVSNLTIEGLTFQHMNSNLSSSVGMGISGDHLTIRWNTFLGCHRYCIVGTMTNSLIDSNHMNGQSPGQDAGCSSPTYAAIQNWPGSTNVTISHNLSENMQGGAIALQANHFTVDRNKILNVNTNLCDWGAIYVNHDVNQPFTISNNYISGNGGVNYASDQTKSIYLDDLVSNATVSGNICRSCGSDAFQIHGGVSNVITNNVFDLSTGVHAMGLYQTSPAGATGMTGNVFTKNIVYDSACTWPQLWVISLTSGNALPAVSHNLYYSGCAGTAPNIGAVDSSPTNANPQFTNAATGNYSMPSTSPAFSAIGFTALPTDQGPLPNPFITTTTTAPMISSFTASPSSITAGASSSLAWSVSNATSISINQGVGVVTGSSVNVSPSGTTTYTLTATNSTGTNSAQATVTVNAVVASRRVIGLEPSRQFSGTLPAGVSECAYGSYLRAMTSAFGGSCPNFIKEGDMWPHAYWPTSAQAAYMPASSMAYNVKVTSGGTSGLPGQIFFGGDQTENIMNAGDSTYLNWLHTVYLPLVMSSGQAGTTKTKFGWYLWTMDGFTPNLDQLGTTVGTSFTTNVTPDIGFPQTASAWNAGWAAYFTYAKTHNSPVRFSPHLGRMEDWGQFQTIFADCPALLREWFNMSDLTNYNIQFYNQTLSMYWFANVAPPVFPNDPPTRIIDYGVNVNNGDIHTGLAIYSMIRGPNTFFSCLNGTQTACDPALWLPTATKLGDGTSGPLSIIGTGLSSVLKRTFQGGIAYLDVKAGPQTVSLPPGSFDWNGNPITSLSLNTGKGDVVLNTNVIVGNGPVISSFSASPSNISSGASSTLSWSVTNATSLSITPGIGTVTGTSVSVSPTVGTTYTLTASNANGSVSASTTVTVGGSGGGVGGSHAWWRVNTTLASNACCAGNAYGASAAEMEFRTTVGGSNVATGGTPISGGNYPGQTPNLAFDSNPATFWAGPGPIFGPPVLTWIGYHFASPQPIAEYTWTSRDGIADYQVPINMNFDYSDNGTTWTTLCSPTSTDADWPVVSQTNSFSCPGLVLPVITSFTASPSTITSGSSTLSWATTGGATTSINQGVGTVSNTGTTSVSPALTTTYTLTATNSAGSVSQTVTVTVSSVTSLPVISSFTATPSTILPSGSSTLAWTTSGSTSLSIDHGVGTVTGLTSTSVSPTATTIYTLTATNPAGSVTQSVTVTLQAPPLPTIVNFIATPPVISLGGSSTLSWITTDATSLSIDQGIGLVTGTTSKVVSPTVTTTYTLTVSNSVGQVTGTATVTIGAAASAGFIINGATIRGATIPAH